LLCDIRTWADEQLVDGLVVAGYYVAGGNADLACDYLKKETRNQVPILYYGWVPTTPESFYLDAAAALRAGTREILYWEADYIDNQKPQEREKVVRAIRDYPADQKV
jgi:hypothetical protein